MRFKSQYPEVPQLKLVNGIVSYWVVALQVLMLDKTTLNVRFGEIKHIFWMSTELWEGT